MDDILIHDLSLNQVKLQRDVAIKLLKSVDLNINNEKYVYDST